MSGKKKLPAESDLWSDPSPIATPQYWSPASVIAKAANSSFSVFAPSGLRCSDIRQHYGCCFLAALLSIAYRYPAFLENLFVKRDLWKFGVFTVVFCGDSGKLEEIDVDDMLPADPDSKEVYFAKPRDGAFWVPLMEKAFAKFCRSWSEYESASVVDVYESLSRAPVVSHPHEEFTHIEMLDRITEYLTSGYPMVVETGESAHLIGLAPDQSFAVLSADSAIAGFDRCICLCSPCETNDFKGQLVGVGTGSIEGSFYVTLDEYMSAFEITHACLLNRVDIWVHDGENLDLDPFWMKMWSSDTIKDLKLVLEHDDRTHWHRNMISTPARLQRLWLGGDPYIAGGSELAGFRLLGTCAVSEEQPLTMTRWRPDQIDWAERIFQDIRCFASAPDIIKHDPMIGVQLVSKDGMMLEKLIRPLRADRVVAAVAVRQNGLALEHVQAALKSDHTIVLHAVRQNGLALQYASTALKGDMQLVMEAITQNPMSLRFASSLLRSDPEVIQYACVIQGKALEHATEEFRLGADLGIRKAVSLLAVRQDGLSLAHTAPDLRLDGDVVLVAVCQNAEAIKWADAWFRNHRFMINVTMGKSKAPVGSWKSLCAWAETNGRWDGCWDALKAWHAAHPEE